MVLLYSSHDPYLGGKDYLPQSWFLPFIQGAPNQNLLVQMAITLKISKCHPMFVKLKCVSLTKSFYLSTVCLQFCSYLFTIMYQNKPMAPNHILAFGLITIRSEMHSFRVSAI